MSPRNRIAIFGGTFDPPHRAHSQLLAQLQSEMNFDRIFASHEWRPIRNCPGRYTLANAGKFPTIESIVGDEALVEMYRSSECEDRVLVARLMGGGAILSYLRTDGTQFHTLNDQSGFERKIDQLKIELTGSA